MVRIESLDDFLMKEEVLGTEHEYRWESSHAGNHVEKRRADDKSMTRALMPRELGRGCIGAPENFLVSN